MLKTQPPYQPYYNESMALSHASFFAMNTNMELVVCGLKKPDAEMLFHSAYLEIKRIEKMLNRFDPQSEVAKLNSLKSGTTPISSELCSILEQCSTLNRQTGCFFDVCINPDRPAVPGMKGYHLDKKNHIIGIGNAPLNFDFGAFAKGYALEKLKVFFIHAQGNNALVNFGNSSIMALGHHPHGDCWKISLHYDNSSELPAQPFDLSDEVLTTSGVMPSRKAHIRSPFTGRLLKQQANYSVVTQSAIDGEAISTALYAAREGALQKAILKNFSVTSAWKTTFRQGRVVLAEITT